MSEARAAVLGRIRGALGGAGEREREISRAEAWGQIARGYRRGSVGTRDEVMALLEDRLRDYDATVERVGVEELPGALDRVLAESPGRRVLVAEGFAAEWLPRTHAVAVNRGFSPRELDGFDAVLTGATLAIAETGTLVLQGVPGQGRRAATLVPDVHLCVVRMRDVVATVPEAMARLEGTARLPTTFVSGPSATADIEMTRIKGVHGPRFLHVFLLADGREAEEIPFDSEARV